MSPRPRTVQDDAILDAAVRVLSRMGTEKMTLADVGGEVGLSAATLVQRFGSKRDLLLNLLKHYVAGIDARFEAAIAANPSPLDALFAAATGRPMSIDGTGSLGHRLAFYLGQLDDPEFRAIASQHAERAVAGFRRLIESAVDAGELSEGYTDTAQLAETIYSMIMGSLFTWSVTQEGSVASRIRRDLDILLRPFRRGPRKAAPQIRTLLSVL